LLDTVTYRVSGHSPSDAATYRDRAEIDEWRANDPIAEFGEKLIDSGLASKEELGKITKDIEEIVFNACKNAVDYNISPTTTLSLREETLLSNLNIPNLDQTKQPEVLIPKSENPRFKKLAELSRSGLDSNGNELPRNKCIAVRDAIFEAVLDAFYTDSTLIAYGEDNRDWGGAFAVYRGLTESLPYHRFFNAPIVEGSIVGTACGYALAGGRALVELMYCDFLGRCGDEVFNQISKWQSMSAGILRMPVVVRLMVGSRYGAQHSQDWSSLCAHIPGLKVVFPATPYDAKGIMASALKGTDPVMFFENQRLYDMTELFEKDGVPTESYEIPIGEPDIKKQGSDITILSIGAALYQAVEASRILQENHGLSCEIIDARSIVPFDYEKVIESVKKTGYILLVSDACDRGSILQTMAAKINQFCFDYMDAPPVVVGARNWVAPHYEAEHEYLPFASQIIDAVNEHLILLDNYSPQRNCSNLEQIRRSKEGV
jgi:2-oxoisovalerate dehydrogenase E1 component